MEDMPENMRNIYQGCKDDPCATRDTTRGLYSASAARPTGRVHDSYCSFQAGGQYILHINNAVSLKTRLVSHGIRARPVSFSRAVQSRH